MTPMGTTLEAGLGITSKSIKALGIDAPTELNGNGGYSCCNFL
jgi:hypothetical protein